MSTLKTGALRGTSGTADSIQLHASNQSVTFPGDVTVTGDLTGGFKAYQSVVSVNGSASAVFSIPTGVNRFELSIVDVSTANDSSTIGMELGHGSGPTYLTSSGDYNGTYHGHKHNISVYSYLEESKVRYFVNHDGASNIYSGFWQFSHIDNNEWVWQGGGHIHDSLWGTFSSGYCKMGGSNTLSSVRFKHYGSGNFDGGKVMLRYWK